MTDIRKLSLFQLVEILAGGADSSDFKEAFYCDPAPLATSTFTERGLRADNFSGVLRFNSSVRQHIPTA